MAARTRTRSLTDPALTPEPRDPGTGTARDAPRGAASTRGRRGAWRGHERAAAGRREILCRTVGSGSAGLAALVGRPRRGTAHSLGAEGSGRGRGDAGKVVNGGGAAGATPRRGRDGPEPRENLPVTLPHLRLRARSASQRRILHTPQAGRVVGWVTSRDSGLTGRRRAVGFPPWKNRAGSTGRQPWVADSWGPRFGGSRAFTPAHSRSSLPQNGGKGGVEQVAQRG